MRRGPESQAIPPLVQQGTEIPQTSPLYFAHHAPRYRLLLGLLCDYVTPATRLLDVGPSILSSLVAQKFRIPVDTLGLGHDQRTEIGRHWMFELNDAACREKWRSDFGPYDAIVMAEVLEHLHTSPALVLDFLRSLLVDSGILVVQTPNAAALHKRVKLLLGRNPYTLISEDLSDPLHFREYTMEELEGYLGGAGFEILRLRSDSYFDYRYPTTERRRPFLARLGVVNLIYGCLPARLKPGFTVVARARA